MDTPPPHAHAYAHEMQALCQSPPMRMRETSGTPLAHFKFTASMAYPSPVYEVTLCEVPISTPQII